MTSIALTIAGSDPSGGAGIQADLKTFHQFGVYGQAVLTLLTVQNTQTVARVEYLTPELVTEQIQAILDDMPPQAVKTGALGQRAVVEAVAAMAESFSCPLVVDPVMISKQGAALISDDGRHAVRDRLLPLAFLFMPNLHEAAAVTGEAVSDVDDMFKAAERIHKMGAKHVLIKGGHLEGAAVDVLLTNGEFHKFAAERVDTPHTHGTGCTYSAAITAQLAKGAALLAAVSVAKDYITRAIQTNPGLGGGSGPVNHHADYL